MERMGRARPPYAYRRCAPEQSAELQPIQSGRAREALERGQTDGFTLGHELQCVTLVILEGPDALFDELAEPNRHGQRSGGPAKHRARIGPSRLPVWTGAALGRSTGFPGRGGPRPPRARYPRHHRGSPRRVRRRHAHQAGRGRCDRRARPSRAGPPVRGLPHRPARRDHKGVASHRQLEDERRRHLVEQISIIDHDHEWSAGRERIELTSGGVGRIDALPQLGQDRAQRTERDGAATRVAASRAVAAPPPSERASAWLARRVLPRPASPAITTPPAPSARRAAMCRSSRSRPTRCQLGVIGFDSTPRRMPGGNLVPGPRSLPTSGAPRPPSPRISAAQQDRPRVGWRSHLVQTICSGSPQRGRPHVLALASSYSAAPRDRPLN